MRTITLLLFVGLSANAQNIIGGTDDGPSKYLSIGGTLDKPLVTNISDQSVMAYSIRRHTDGRSTTFHETEGLKPGQSKNLGLLMTWGHDDDGTTLDYEVTAVMFSNGNVVGRHAQRLNDAFWREIRGHRAPPAKNFTPLDRGAYGPFKAGTPTWGYSGDANVAETVQPGYSSTVASNYAFCFSGPVTAFGYRISGGLIQHNESAPCGPLNAYLTAVQVSFRADHQYDQLRQQGLATAVFGNVYPSGVTQYEGCDYPGDDGVVGDYYITAAHPGECQDPIFFNQPSSQ